MPQVQFIKSCSGYNPGEIIEVSPVQAQALLKTKTAIIKEEVIKPLPEKTKIKVQVNKKG